MTDRQTITVNRPLANTFGWLHVNGTRAEAPESTRALPLTLAAGEERTVLTEGADASLEISAELAEGAVLRLIQVRRSGGPAQEINHVRVRCADRARFEWYRIVLGGSSTLDDCSVTLEGRESAFEAEIAYRLGGEERLDMNCEAIHLGRRTRSEILASGVLREKAFKLLRGTIDLRTGCAGAVGNEMEDVLLVDDTVRNQSVPVILCSEEDVEGNHGATIGRLDESLVFYLASRGMSPEEIDRMMAQAKMDAVLRKIPDAAIREALLEETRA